MMDQLLTKILDPERLAALERMGLLDTPAEEAFDQLTRLTCAILKVPVSLVSLVGKDRQFFKSSVGLPHPWASLRETPLSHSFCQHAVASGKPLIIEDAREHPLVGDNPAIQDLGVIAYAGVPLRTGDGHNLGTLCAIDHQPRVWSSTELELLEHLAACVMSRIELGATVQSLERNATAMRASEERLAAILDSTLDAVVTLNAVGDISSWSRQAEAIFGWSAAEAVGRPLSDLIVPPQYREAHRAGLSRYLATGVGPILRTRVEITALRKDGGEFPVELTVTPFHEDGRQSFSAFIRDITARHEADAALRVATDRFQLLSRATNDAVWDWDVGADTYWVNEGFEVLFGYPPTQTGMVDAPWHTRLHPADRQRVEARLQEVLDRGGTFWMDEYRFRRADGTYADVYDRGYVTRDEGGRAVRMVGAMLDVSALRRAERLQRALYAIAQATTTVAGLQEVLREVHATVSALLPADNFYIALYDPARDLLSFPYFVDQREPAAAARPLGRGLTEWVLRSGESLLATPDVARELEQRGAVELLGEPSVDWLGVPLKARAGTIGVLAVQSYTAGIRYGEREKQILEFVSTQVAMAIERKEVELALKESETRYRLLFESNPEAMWVFDAATLRFLAVNQAAVVRYGYSVEEFLGMTIRDLRSALEQVHLDQLLQQAAGRANFKANVRHTSKHGEIFDVEIVSDVLDFAGRPARLVLARNVSEQKRLEGQLRQSQKMEAVGRLAGGIAHDFNNLLTAITGYSDLLLQDLAPEDPRRQDVEEIGKATARAGALTQQLLAFSRKQVLQPRVIDLNTVVHNAKKLLHRLIGEDIALLTVCEPALGAVEADLAQFEQVIVNLAVNARDAMPRGGKLLIETRNVTVDAAHLTADSVVSPAGYVLLAVTDTGAGMDDATKARLFEPFFTTKGLGKGTETILFVEDEPALRAVARRVLARQGYVMLEAPEAGAALALAAEHEGTIHLLVTDVIMPGLSGHELALRLTAIRPQLRVLYISGYTDEAIGHHGVLAPGVEYLQKPFSPDALARRVRAVLDAPHAAGADRPL